MICSGAFPELTDSEAAVAVATTAATPDTVVVAAVLSSCRAVSPSDVCGC